MKEIDFWFSIGSTYTYLSVSRLKEADFLPELWLQNSQPWLPWL